MKTLQKFLVKGLIIPSLLSASCVDPNLTPLQQSFALSYTTVGAQFCTLPPAPLNQKIKYLFILDHSASNLPSAMGNLNPNPVDMTATDPTGSRRYGPIATFIQNLIPNPNVPASFSLLDFNTSANFPNGVSGSVFDSNQGNFQSNLLADWTLIYGSSANNPGTGAPNSDTDLGYTDYEAALLKAVTLIASDATNESEVQVENTNPVQSVYQIFFVSDGQPVILNNGSLYTEQFTDIQPELDALTQLKNDVNFGPYIANVFINTVYYYNDRMPATTQILNIEAQARALLQSMATYGNGQYFESSDSSEPISFQNFAPPLENIRYILSDVFIENESGHWWDNSASFFLDSDNDGMPDTIESKLGSANSAVDSDGNGVSDLVEYRTKGIPCNDAKCSTANRDPYSICNGLGPVQGPNNTVTFPSTSKDGLNDCEKLVLGISPKNFNNAGDFIPDLLALKSGLPLLVGQTQAFLDPFGDGMNNYTKLKLGYPLTLSSSKIINFTPRSIQIDHIDSSSTPGQDCYQITANNVAITGNNNKIKISVVQNRSMIEDKPVLLSAERTIAGQASTYFSPGDFQ